MRILISGGSGLIGGALKTALEVGGHELCHLVRRAPRTDDEFRWDPQCGQIDLCAFDGIEGLIHLGGESVASGLWTKKKKERLRSSRLRSSELLSRTIASSAKPPRVFLCASAVGIYGNRGAEELNEGSVPGSGFLAELCKEWEALTHTPKSEVRVINLRFGIVLSKQGGALRSMLPAFRLGIAGKFGSGAQYLSWVALSDAAAAIKFCLENEAARGAINIVAPNPVTNQEFTRALGTALRRPTFLGVPAFVLRLILGEMADEMLLSSARVRPKKLEELGFRWGYPELGGYFANEL